MPPSPPNPLLNDKWAAVLAGTLAGVLKASGNTVAVATASTDYSVPAATETFTGSKTHRKVQSAGPATFGDDAAISIQQDLNGSIVGNVAWAVFNTGQVFPLHLQTYFDDAGNIRTGRSMAISQKRNDNGSVQIIAEQSMLDVSADIPNSCVNLENGIAAHGPNAYCVACYDLDDLDPVYPGGAYSPGSGKKKFAISAKGDLIWGTNLGLTPDANRVAKIFFDISTTPNTLRLIGNAANSPFDGSISFYAPIQVPWNKAINSVLVDGSSIGNIMTVDAGNNINIGGSFNNTYLRLKTGGYSQITDPVGNPIVYFQLPTSTTFYGNVAAPSLTVNGGTPVVKILSATATLDFPSTPAQTSSDLTITVTGAVVGDTVSIGLPAAPPANSSFSGYVSAADTVTVRFCNFSSGAVDPASGTYRASVIRF